MIKHYLTFAFRILLRNKVFSLINIVGLAIGLASFFFITIYLVNEFSYDKMYPKKDQIHRIITNFEDFDNFENGLSAYSIGQKFTNAFPEIQSYSTCRLSRLVIHQNKENYTELAQCTNSNLFEMFDLPIIAGDKHNPLKELNSIVISEKIAKKLFKDENPIGKTLEISNRSTNWTLVVTAVIKDISWNSTLRGDLFVNIELYLKDHVKWYNITNIHENWNGGFLTYFLLSKNTDVKRLEEKANEFYLKNSDNKQKMTFTFQPLSDVYLHSSGLQNNILPSGNLSNILIFSLIGLLILMIAGFNFVILSSAQNINRHKEIGFRKVAGETNFGRFKQFFIESLLISLIVMPISIFLVILFMPKISVLFNQTIEFKNSNMVIYILLFFLIGLILSVISGLHISLSSAKLEAVDIMRGSSKKGNSKLILRKMMIVFQITIFIALLIVSLNIRKQLNFSKNVDMGYDTENILKVRWPYFKFNDYEVLMQAFQSNPYILSISYGSSGPPSFSYAKSKMPKVNNPDEVVECEFMNIGYNYLETYGIKLTDGRFFSKDFGTDESGFIINESAYKSLGITDIKNIPNNKYNIIGVVKDFHLHSLKDKINPLMIAITKKYINEILIKVDPKHKKEVISFLEEEWGKNAPNLPFNYIFIKDSIKNLYYRDIQFAKIINTFTIMSIFVASLGLFGLTLFTIQNRIKEIGIRKVYGASLNNIMIMMNREFAILVILASIIAWPIAYYFMNQWLKSFSYTIHTPFELYVLSSIIAMIIVLLTISIRSLKAALSNPVDAIRYE